jgi:hypothetical protein
MAHFEMNGRKISTQTIPAFKGVPLQASLWGPINTYVTPSQELKVVPNPLSAVDVFPLAISKDQKVRKLQIKGKASGTVRIEAKAGDAVWDWFEIDIAPASYALLTKQQQEFIANMASAGSAKAAECGFPLSAMIACACGESAYGTSDIFNRTGCPFNLQKPADWEYPKCETEEQATVSKLNQKAAPVSFCKAKSLSDAARLWCEWISHWPNESNKNTLLTLRRDPKAFAENLFLVGFADSKKAATKAFGTILEQFELRRFD